MLRASRNTSPKLRHARSKLKLETHLRILRCSQHVVLEAFSGVLYWVIWVPVASR